MTNNTTDSYYNPTILSAKIEPYFLEHAEHDLYEQVKHLKPSQREKKLERIATIWLKELK